MFAAVAAITVIACIVITPIIIGAWSVTEGRERRQQMSFAEKMDHDIEENERIGKLFADLGIK